MGALKTTNADPFESLNVEPARPTEPIKSLKGIINSLQSCMKSKNLMHIIAFLIHLNDLVRIGGNL